MVADQFSKLIGMKCGSFKNVGDVYFSLAYDIYLICFSMVTQRLLKIREALLILAKQIPSLGTTRSPLFHGCLHTPLSSPSLPLSLPSPLCPPISPTHPLLSLPLPSPSPPLPPPLFSPLSPSLSSPPPLSSPHLPHV